MVISEFGKNYLLLGLRIDKHINGYVDAYFGPKKISEKVKGETLVSPKTLLKSCEDLQQQLKNQGFSQDRNKFLEKMLNAVKVSLKILNGVSYSFSEQVQNLYDVIPEFIDDNIFFQSAEKLNSLLEGTEKLQNKVAQFKTNNTIPNKDIEQIFKKTLAITRNRTLDLFPNLLPENENFEVEIVRNKPWGAYNWYLGDYLSKIEINLDTPSVWIHMIPTAAHEGYPGHHTEHSIKDKVLYHDQGRFEHSILLIPTPESVMAEGIGNTAIGVLFSFEELADIALNQICPFQSPDLDEEQLIEYYKILRNIRGFYNNLAIHAHIDGYTDEELINYGLEFGLWTKIELKRYLKFIRHPLWAPYVFTYKSGEKLIQKKYGDRPSPENFTKLLTQPILPSDLL